jgi:hypothetical protein
MRAPGMKNVLLALALALGALGGCVAGLGDGPTTPAPDPLPEFQSPPSAPGLVWVGGKWHWQGADWVWVPGHYESPPPLP